ncbi:MAG: NAD(P)H-dependent glycerol-3-phosphate dehydrogenase [bacterium]
MNNKKICVLGAGGWGTTLAIHLYKKRFEVSLWEAFPDYAEVLLKQRKNPKFLPGIDIPAEIYITSKIDEAISDASLVVYAVPSHVMRKVAKSSHVPEGVVKLSVAKGIENKTLKRMSEIIAEETSNTNIVILSGPSHAEEVVRGIPTTVVVSGKDMDVAKHVQTIFMAENFRVYTNSDVIGVELGGALKNIIAIAAGISDGLGFGDNTKSALLTRGLAEIKRLGVKMGANPHTFSGLSGIGDLITTCTSKHSRNRFVGEQIAKGRTLSQILDSMSMVSEGVKTTQSAYSLSERYSVDMPITTEIHEVLFNNKDPRKAVMDLMTRDAKSEIE